jgi:hypothetical protein
VHQCGTCEQDRALLLSALTRLTQVCIDMDLDNQAERPTEEEYLRALADAGAAIKAAGGAS